MQLPRRDLNEPILALKKAAVTEQHYRDLSERLQIGKDCVIDLDLRFDHRKENRENRALSGGALHVDPAAMGFDDGLNQA
jgi:hypothetical protein